MLRLYEGCANRTIGRLELFHTKTPKISYLFTLTLILIPIPPCTPSMQIDLRELCMSADMILMTTHCYIKR